jgi:hypothetical protein
MGLFYAKDFCVVVFFGTFTEPNKHSMDSEKPKVKRHHARYIASDGPILDEYVVNVNVFKNKDPFNSKQMRIFREKMYKTGCAHGECRFCFGNWG